MLAAAFNSGKNNSSVTFENYTQACLLMKRLHRCRWIGLADRSVSDGSNKSMLFELTEMPPLG
jgi:hypothetical protein